MKAYGLLSSFLGMLTVLQLYMDVAFQIPRNMSEFFKGPSGHLTPSFSWFLVNFLLIPAVITTSNPGLDSRGSSVSGQIKTSPVSEGFQGTAIQIKNDNSLGLTLIRMVTMKRKEVLVQMWRKLEPLCTLGRNIKWCSHYGKKYVWQFPKIKKKKKAITIWSNDSTSAKISRIIESTVWCEEFGPLDQLRLGILLGGLGCFS